MLCVMLVEDEHFVRIAMKTASLEDHLPAAHH
jgi:hypothetical protein